MGLIKRKYTSNQHNAFSVSEYVRPSRRPTCVLPRMFDEERRCSARCCCDWLPAVLGSCLFMLMVYVTLLLAVIGLAGVSFGSAAERWAQVGLAAVHFGLGGCAISLGYVNGAIPETHCLALLPDLVVVSVLVANRALFDDADVN